MLAGQNRHSAWMPILLVGLISAGASRVDADCFGNLFYRDKTDSYVKLANELYKSTPSGELKDNLEAAVVLRQDAARSNDKLLAAFSSLKDSDWDYLLCDSESIEALRLLAEGLEAHGNLRANRMTEPIRRLNRIVIKQIMRARTFCFDTLANKWPNTGQVDPKWMIWPARYRSLRQLDSLPQTLLLDSQSKLGVEQFKEIKHLQTTCSLTRGAYRPDSVLRPYANLLMASYIIDPKSNKLAKLYEDPSERIVLEQVYHPSKEVLSNAYRLMACDLLLASTNNE